jgi:Zn-dependent protease with chaperone function
MKNFFEHQDAARKNTARLVILFSLAMLLTITGVYFITLLSVKGYHIYNHYNPALGMPAEYQDEMAIWWDFRAFVFSIFCTAIVVGGGTLWKIRQLARGGGSLVCEQLGGRFVDLRTDDFREQRLINVVQEMAIASGVSVPLLYVLDRERGINAFAAGFTANNAALAVSRGALDLLSRDELQGVIAHEFSHILNGDMRLNIRMIGVLHGIMMLAVTGLTLIRVGFGRSAAGIRPRNDSEGGGLPLAVVGAALVLIGYGGRFVGKTIKSAISRQREYLADASAVQFTRNPDGLAGALKKIGGWPAGSKIDSMHAEQVSHMFFGDGFDESLWVRWLFATHPPLKERIRRIDPYFSGAFPIVNMNNRGESPVSPGDFGEPTAEQREMQTKQEQQEQKKQKAGQFAADLAVAGAVLADGGSPLRDEAGETARRGLNSADALQSAGKLSQQHVDHARELLDAIPDEIREAARDPFGAAGVAFALLLDPIPEVRAAQIDLLATELTAGLAEETRRAAQLLQNLEPTLRLPLLEILVPALRTMSQTQYTRFMEILGKLIDADHKVTLFEFALKRLIEHRLQASHGAETRRVAQYYSLSPLRRDSMILLSCLAHAGSDDPAGAEFAFAEGVKAISIGETNPEDQMALLAGDELSFERLDAALDRISRANNGIKHRIVRATAACVLADQNVSIEEAQILRVMCEVVDVPLPPFLP